MLLDTGDVVLKTLAYIINSTKVADSWGLFWSQHPMSHFRMKMTNHLCKVLLLTEKSSIAKSLTTYSKFLY